MHDFDPIAEVPIIKDSSEEGPIPSVWRPTFRDIVKAFAQGDFKISAGIPGVLPVSDKLAGRMAAYIKDYGEVLTELPEETWKTSVCIWTGRGWDATIDLWTLREGCSDLVLQVFVTEFQGGFKYDIHMVYVP